MEAIYKYKLKMKAADVSDKGRVTILANGLEIKDYQGDISARGSFKKTLNDFKNGKNIIYHYLNHDNNRSIGLILDGYENDTHLVLESQLNLNKQIGREVYEDYRLAAEYGRNVEHSVGVIPIKRDPKNKARVLEWVLKEVSTLTKQGANPSTGFIDLKSLDAENNPAQAISYIRSVLSARYSDEKLKEFEKTLNILEKAMEDKEIKIVQCSHCGLAFDYNSVQEKNMLDELLKTRHKNISQELVEKDADLLANMREKVLEALQTDKSADKEFMFVNCPKCNHHIYKEEYIDITEKAAKKEEENDNPKKEEQPAKEEEEAENNEPSKDTHEEEATQTQEAGKDKEEEDDCEKEKSRPEDTQTITWKSVLEALNNN